MIAFASVSSTGNAAITDHVADWLAQHRFAIERTTYVDPRGVTKHNLVARRDGHGGGGVVENRGDREPSGLAYFCHTDVVPADRWNGPGGDPFAAVIDDGRLYGRGACDMKGSLSAMMSAIERLDAATQRGPLWVVCTADEETHLAGAQQLVRASDEYRRIVALDPVSIIGEPTRCRVVHGHKGIHGYQIESIGRAAHSSTRDGVNANLAMVPMLQTLLELHHRCESDRVWQDDRFDPPTLSFNFGISDHAVAVNVVPDRSVAWVTFRTMPAVDGQELVGTMRDQAARLGLRLEHKGGCDPLWTDSDASCVRAFCELARPHTDTASARTACYATDGAVLTELSRRIVCGPGDIAQAHTVDEYITLEQLDRGTALYHDAIARFCR